MSHSTAPLSLSRPSPYLIASWVFISQPVRHYLHCHLISSWSSFTTPRVEHTALPAPSVHHHCLQFTCVSQPCILQQVINISHCLPSPVCMSIRWLPHFTIFLTVGIQQNLSCANTPPIEQKRSLQTGGRL